MTDNNNDNIEFEKLKIELLRDAYKDVVDTVRALDKKIRYIISFNALALGFISSVLMLFRQEFNINIFSNYFVKYFIIFIIIIWISHLIKLLLAINPIMDQTIIFSSEKDKNSCKKCFFILHELCSFSKIPKELIDTKVLVQKYDASIKNLEDIKSLQYKQISALSYIRDVKVRSIKFAINATVVLTVLSFSLLLFLLTPQAN